MLFTKYTSIALQPIVPTYLTHSSIFSGMECWTALLECYIFCVSPVVQPPNSDAPQCSKAQ